jgi:hypothetical protein
MEPTREEIMAKARAKHTKKPTAQKAAEGATGAAKAVPTEKAKKPAK